MHPVVGVQNIPIKPRVHALACKSILMCVKNARRSIMFAQCYKQKMLSMNAEGSQRFGTRSEICHCTAADWQKPIGMNPDYVQAHKLERLDPHKTCLNLYHFFQASVHTASKHIKIQFERKIPGPPEEKEPPPPRRYCKTVAVTAAFVSLQPPSSSNATAECVIESALNCLQRSHKL